MKKSPSPLRLHRETLRHLAPAQMARALGAAVDAEIEPLTGDTCLCMTVHDGCPTKVG